MEIPIIFEDDTVCVIDKPAGVMVHEDGHNEGETVVEWLLRREPQARGVGEPGRSPQGKELERSGVVHRLDKDTSGVLILAKTQEAFVHLKAQFHDRLVKKEYRALVYGTMKERWGSIDRPIGRSAKDFRLRSAEAGAKGARREAQTDWECLVAGTYEDEAFSYLKLMPTTGRTHQLRVHLKAIGRPVVGDVLYAAHLIPSSNNLGMHRLALHAHTLTIELPKGREALFEAPLPTELASAVARLGS